MKRYVERDVVHVVTGAQMKTWAGEQLENLRPVSAPFVHIDDALPTERNRCHD
jgi:hypothetical protein